MDNTWATPLYFRPFEHGVDVSIQAATKYIVGHADAMLGRHHVECARGQAGGRGQGAARRLPRIGGDVPRGCAACARCRRASPSTSARGWKSRAGSKAARRSRACCIPACRATRSTTLWKRDFLGASGLFSVVLKPVGKDAVAAMLDGLQLFGMGFSWGGYESLVIPFDAKTYRTATKWDAEGPGAALPYRARGCRRFARRPRSRLPAPQRREMKAATSALPCARPPGQPGCRRR